MYIYIYIYRERERERERKGERERERERSFMLNGGVPQAVAFSNPAKYVGQGEGQGAEEGVGHA